MTAKMIVVGTDGTDSSRAAVRWAAREAQRHRAVLRIVHTFPAVTTPAGEYSEVVRAHAEAVTSDAFDQARKVAPTVALKTDTVTGKAAVKLLALDSDADLIVLGNRGRGGFSALLLGSVSQRVATHARCPVVIVRGRGDVTDGPVVAGVDDSPAAEHVLATAFEQAAARAASLVLIRTYVPAVPLWIGDVPAVELEPLRNAATQAALDELAAPWRAKYPQLNVRTVVSHGNTAAVLEHESRHAQLVVVGHRGHGTITGTLLGSTGLALAHHAGCPVLITRTGPGAQK